MIHDIWYTHNSLLKWGNTNIHRLKNQIKPAKNHQQKWVTPPSTNPKRMHRVSDGLAFVSALFFAIAAYPRATRASRATQIPRRPKSLGKSVYHFITCSVFGLKIYMYKYIYIYIYMLYQSGEHNLTQCWVSVGSIELMGNDQLFFRMVQYAHVVLVEPSAWAARWLSSPQWEGWLRLVSTCDRTCKLVHL